MPKCQICQGSFQESEDQLVVCGHHKGPVHYGCCANVCSEHGEPCDHAHGVYEKQ